MLTSTPTSTVAFTVPPVSTLRGTSLSPPDSSGPVEILTFRDPFSDIFGSDDEEEAPVLEFLPSTSVSSPQSNATPQLDSPPKQDSPPQSNISESNAELDNDGSYFNFFLSA